MPASASAPDRLAALRYPNYRLWFAGASISNIGTWMQSTAQDWLVLTELTDHDAKAVGVVMALQFGPQVLLLPWTGTAADSRDRRSLLIATQTGMALCALSLGLLTMTHVVALWHVYGLAALTGIIGAFDAPARQTFVGELVREPDMASAVALNATSFNAARMAGPAVSGMCIAITGSGWAFIANGISFLLMLGLLLLIRRSDLRPQPRMNGTGGSIADGFRYVFGRPDLRAMTLMLALLGTFGLNFPIFISTMSVGVFRADAAHYGLLTSIMAVGTFVGALLAVWRGQPTMRLLTNACAVFAVGSVGAALAPGYWWFAGALAMIGIASLTFLNGSNALMQLAAEPSMRGRVMAIRLAVTLGGTPVGAPLVGWVANRAGPRWGLAIAVMGAAGAAAIGAAHDRVSRRVASA